VTNLFPKTNPVNTNPMIPTHYLEIILGVMIGIPIGFFICAFFASRRMRRISTREWLAARKFYTGTPSNPFH